MSYFSDYYNLQGEPSLRAYSDPVHMSRFRSLPWMTDSSVLPSIEEAVYGAKLHSLLPRSRSVRDGCLSLVDKRCFAAGMVGTTTKRAKRRVRIAGCPGRPDGSLVMPHVDANGSRQG